MPTYKNTNSDDVFIEGLRIPAKADLFTTEQWIRNLPTGVTLVATTPMFNPVLVSRLITGGSGTDVYTIPASVNGTDLDNALMRITCYGGSCSLHLSDATNTPVINLVNGQSVEINLSNHVVLNVTTTYLEANTKVSQTIYKGGLSFSKI